MVGYKLIPERERRPPNCTLSSSTDSGQRLHDLPAACTNSQQQVMQMDIPIPFGIQLSVIPMLRDGKD